MRHANPTTVNVVVNDRCDRTNVVLSGVVLAGVLLAGVLLAGVLKALPDHCRRLCLGLLEVGASLASAVAERLTPPGFEAAYRASAMSPSWGGHCMPGRPGSTSRS